MKISFLGTNGWYDTQIGNTVCILVETENEYIILDAGNGLYKIDKYIKSSKPIYLFLSHFHLDHIIGLHTLIKYDFQQGINIYGPEGIKDILGTIINSPYTVPLEKLKTKVFLNDLSEGISIPVKCEFKELKHSSECYGYRFCLEDKIVAYCTDTGICDNLLKLADNADLLITECSLKPGQIDEDWPHLNPESAAEAAKKSNVKKLALTHFDAGLYVSLEDRRQAEIHAKTIFKNSFIANDDMEVIV